MRLSRPVTSALPDRTGVWPGRRRAAPARPRERVDAALRRRFVALLDQQLWCFGADVRDRRGNLLLAAGFTRHRPADGAPGSTAYAGRLGEVELVLWGFGIWAAGPADGALFLGRRAPLPLRWRADATPPTRVHAAHPFRAWRAPVVPAAQAAARRLAAATCRALAAHELQLAERLGTAHRAAQLRGAPRAAIRADGMAAAWAAMADRFSDRPELVGPEWPG